MYVADSANYRIRKVGTNGIINSVAGNGVNGISGDGGQATNATVGSFYGNTLAADTVGNYYLAVDNRVRKVGTNGIINTVAGNGSGDFSGDGGQATNAAIQVNYSCAVDTKGNLFIADDGNQRIRKVDTNGIIKTIAGNGLYGFTGDGGSATNASLYNPTDLAVDKAGNVYICDDANNRIRKVNKNGIVFTVAGNGVTGFSGDGGPAINARFNYILAVAVDGANNVYIGDTENNRIRKVSSACHAALSLGGVTTNQQGNYSVLLTDSLGSTSSVPIALSIVSPPAISQQPQSTNVLRNRSVTFGIRASGTPPLYYQWLKNGTNLPGATVSNYLIAVATTNNTGNYRAIVTNSLGSVTSSIASLVVGMPPQNLFVIANAGNFFQLNLVATPNYPYVLQTATNLVPPINWQSIVTNPADTNGNWNFTMTNNPGAPGKFFRALGQ